ncbi:MAG: T9SS type A sorting domain-containing protein [Bacteroidota bacterium]
MKVNKGFLLFLCYLTLSVISSAQDNKDCALTDPLPGLIAVYNLNSSSETEAQDASGFGNNGIFEGNPQWVASDVALLCAINNTRDIVTSTFSAFPNLTYSGVTIPTSLAGHPFEIFDYSGKILEQGIVPTHEISLRQLPAGVYLIRVMDETTQYMTSVTKM